MKQHKWAREIKAWADGAEIESYLETDCWVLETSPTWRDDVVYRIKPQPIITDYYIWANHKGEVRFCHPDKLCETPIEYHYIGKLTLKDER